MVAHGSTVMAHLSVCYCDNVAPDRRQHPVVVDLLPVLLPHHRSVETVHTLPPSELGEAQWKSLRMTQSSRAHDV